MRIKPPFDIIYGMTADNGAAEASGAQLSGMGGPCDATTFSCQTPPSQMLESHLHGGALRSGKSNTNGDTDTNRNTHGNTHIDSESHTDSATSPKPTAAPVTFNLWMKNKRIPPFANPDL